MFRIYVERKPGFQNEVDSIACEIKDFLKIPNVKHLRYFNRYDIQNVSLDVIKQATTKIFCSPQSDLCSVYDCNNSTKPILIQGNDIAIDANDKIIVWEYLPGQYDQRADSAVQCLCLLRESLKNSVAVCQELPLVKTAQMLCLSGDLKQKEINLIQNYLINPVDSRLCDTSVPKTLQMNCPAPKDIPIIEGFCDFNAAQLESYRQKMSLAMDYKDIEFLQQYFIKEKRCPTLTELRLLDTYWSDHCRHTTFNTHITKVDFSSNCNATLQKAWQDYLEIRKQVYGTKEKDHPITLMDVACIGAKYIKKQGKGQEIETSKEINACSVFVDIDVTKDRGKTYQKQKWLLQFKNETHNHPTEIEPFGGAATCIGGAIRDPLSGRAFVYQSMRITGAGDPTVPIQKTLPGKLPQIKLTRQAAKGFSSYGNQIGLATGQVQEMYHNDFVAKRLETGAVIAACPSDLVKREEPVAGDVVVLVGGGTGRDGIGGATGSSVSHTQKSVETAASQVQKGNAPEERKLQRLFRNPNVSKMIKRCNDFGAGGVAVAVGELAAGLDIDLQAVPKKYAGLDGTELAISESQERMAIVVAKEDATKLLDYAKKENLNAVVVATVTNTNRLVMHWQGKTIVDLKRDFLDAAGATHKAQALLDYNTEGSPWQYFAGAKASDFNATNDLKTRWLDTLSCLSCCSQRGLQEQFDGSIGAGSVLFPFGGNKQGTQECGMAALLPVLPPYQTKTASIMTFGFDPYFAKWSPFIASQLAVLQSVTKVLCLGGDVTKCHLTLQEYFAKTLDPISWGQPLAALLGALKAQKALMLPAIGGKDSMSGSFGDMSVPPTLISFAVTLSPAQEIVSGAFKKANSKVYMLSTPYSKDFEPDYVTFLHNARLIHSLVKQDLIHAMYPIEAGGVAQAITKMALGCEIGFDFCAFPRANALCLNPRDKNNLFCAFWGSILIQTDTDLTLLDFVTGTLQLLGYTTDKKSITIQHNTYGKKHLEPFSLSLECAKNAYEKTLQTVFPQTSGKPQTKTIGNFALVTYNNKDKNKDSLHSPIKTQSPKVLLPVFPGTNCEYDMARAFELAGAKTKILVFCNRTQQDLEKSIQDLVGELNDTQILALSGGFSCGDEPDGSGKFIANVLRQHKVETAIMELLENRKGLILGICNGFQALIKTGLLPYGRILDPTENAPTLTFNTIKRHISRIARTKMTSNASVWANHETLQLGSMHYVPISHGEGRVIMSEDCARGLFENGQVFCQYCDENGTPVMQEPDNPNGSAFAIEGITSPNGRILGKMGHSERTIGFCDKGSSDFLLKNITKAGDAITSCQNIFLAGVNYFRV